MRAFRPWVFVSTAALALFFIALPRISDDWIVKSVYAKGGGGGEGGGGGGGGAGGGGAGGGGAGGAGGGGGGGGAGAGGGGGAGGDNAATAVDAEAFRAFLHSPQAIRTTSRQNHEKLKIVRRFHNARGRPCRVVEQSVVISGQKTWATGTVCLQANGQWMLAS